jgi:hypothetical protein
MKDKKRKEVSDFIIIFRSTVDSEDADIYCRMWHGKHGVYSLKLWKKIEPNGETLWEDFVRCSANRDNINKIDGLRLDNLHLYAIKMMAHFSRSLFLYKVFNLFFTIIFLAIRLLDFLWQLWVILVSSAIDFFQCFWKFLNGKESFDADL